MTAANPLAAEILEASAAGFAAAANALMEQDPAADGLRDAGTWQAHLKQRIHELAAAVRIGDTGVFTRRVNWLLRAASARGNEQAPLLLALESLRSALNTELPEHLRSKVVPYIEAALNQPLPGDSDQPSLLDPNSPGGELAQRYVTTCLDGRTGAASRCILDAIDDGLEPATAYAQVLIPAQKEIGHLWHLGKVTVAEERLVSETTRRVMALISSRFAPAEPSGPTMLAASVSGNAHDIGLRVVSDLFMLAGWRCLFLGANVPAADIAVAARDFEASLAVLTVTMATQLHALAGTIEVIRQQSPQTCILVGGSAFDESPTAWKQLGADAYAGSVDVAVECGRRLVESRS